MNKLILLLGFLMLIPFAFADNENGKITAGKDLWITDVDTKVDGLISRNLEYEKEISRTAKPNSIIKLDIELRNNNSGLTMQDAFVEATIDDLDLTDTSEEIDINPSSDKVLSLELVLPSDAEDTTYDILILAEGKLNNSIHKVEYQLDLVVEIPKEEQQSPDSLTTKIDSLNSTVNQLNKNIDSYFEPYAKCVSEKDALKEQLNTKDTTIAGLQGYESKFTICNDNLLICSSEKADKSAANETCNYLIRNEYAPKLKSQQNWIFMALLGGAGVVYLYYFTKEKKSKRGTESEEKSPEEAS